MEQKERALLPCPFCGGKAEMCGSYGSSTMYVRCKKCGAQTFYDYKDRAAIKWNKRTDTVKGIVSAFKCVCLAQGGQTTEETACLECPIHQYCGTEPYTWEA